MNNTAIFFLCTLGLASGFVDKTIVQWLSDDGGFKTLVSAVKTAGLADALSGPGPLTIFAPTDAAFGRLRPETLNKLLQNPPQLAALLRYHVLNEFLVSPMVKKPDTKTTLEGETLTIAPNNGGLYVNNYATVNANNEDIVVNNGVIHPIENILIPQNLPVFTITQFLLQDDREFVDLSLSLVFANLTSVLDGGEYTMFAPVDSATLVYKDNLLNPNSFNAQTIYQEVLKYHVVKGTVMSSQLSDGQTLTTLHGTTISVKIDSSGVMINNATVINPDILCTNGVIHALNSVLIPQDIYTIGQG